MMLTPNRLLGLLFTRRKDFKGQANHDPAGTTKRKTSRRITLVLMTSVLMTGVAIMAVAQTRKEPKQVRAEAKALQTQGNWKEALDMYQTLLVDPNRTGEEAAQDLRAAAECQQNLGLPGEIDELIAKALPVHGEKWEFLSEAARQIQHAPHAGMVADQKFHRNPRVFRATGRWVNVYEADRHQALMWTEKALRLAGLIPAADQAAPAEPNSIVASERARLWQQMLGVLLEARHHRFGWMLQAKTPMDKSPEYTDFEAPQNNVARYAATDEEGQPILWKVPASWSEADSDAERVRWVLKQMASLDQPAAFDSAQMTWADFLNSQFSVDTLQEMRWMRTMAGESSESGEATDGQFKDESTGILAVHTLADTETIAKLSSGVRRFTLPDDLNPIRIYQQMIASKRGSATQAYAQLVNIHLNRRQYNRAAELLKEALKSSGGNEKYFRDLLESIEQPRGAFDPVRSQAAGQNAKLGFVFRNAKAAAFTARRVDVDKLFADIKQFYRDSRTPPSFGGQRNTYPPSIEFPHQLFHAANVTKYLGPTVASWTQTLTPRENHWDRRIAITTPLDRAGLYLVDASLDDGAHQVRCLVWIQDLAIVRKGMNNSQLIYVADAITSQPVAGATVEFFGFTGSADQRRQFVVQSLAKKTDAQGQIVFNQNDMADKQWFIVARDAKGRTAISSNQSLWFNTFDTQHFHQVKAYGVADQPVHRPGDKIKGKFWLGRASYDPEMTTTAIARQPVELKIINPRGEEFWKETKTTDEYGGVEFETELPKSAMLGTYAFQLFFQGNPIESNLQVRVEEFRKPEFEVKIEAPEKPVKLGEKVEATIRAKYYFGTPVTDAKVTVKVTRSAYQDDWYPVRPYDWCYGPGYWWFAYDYSWYPGWHRWAGCFMPHDLWMPMWGRFGMEPPELVLEQEVKLDADGTAKITIDSSIAAAVQAKQDHKYDISVEVRDASRRTITASGSVIAAREAFKIYSWLHRGYYQVGDAIDASFMAQTLDRRPVQATGKLDLLRITYDDKRQPQETVVESWDAKSDENGSATQRLVVRRGGQYRLRMTLTDEAGNKIEGAYIFTVRGDKSAADNFQFTELELIPDKSEYAPGEKVNLQINANRADATVLLFIRPSDGVVPAPKMVKLVNKTAQLVIDVKADDQPNFFVEALTVYDGKFYSQIREIIVPPANQVLNVTVKPDKPEYLPGEKAGLDIEVKDADGKPVVGSLLVAIYDRALEQIAGDVLPGDIREYFWKWRRTHHAMNFENLSRVMPPVLIHGLPMLGPLGIFGDMTADSEQSGESDMSAASFGGGGMGGGMGGMGRHMRGLGGPPGGMAGMAFDAAEGMSMKSMANAAPMAAAAPTADRMAAGGMAGGEGGGGPQPGLAQTSVRKEFADSVLWLTSLKTDRNGRAHADYTMAENLSDWQMRTWALGPNLRVGSGQANAVTHKHILVRLTTPRFLTQRDEVVLSAIVHNDFDAAHDVRVRLEIDGQTQLEMMDGVAAERTVHIEAHQQARVDWRCKALAEGEVTLRAFAESSIESDAMQLKLPIIVNGLLKTDSWAGTVRADQPSATISMNVPQARRVEQSRLLVQMSPSLALSMVDALPYMVDYPYGCTEQTLNRFLPTVITQRMLLEMNVDLKQVKDRRNNLNAQEIGDGNSRAAGWKRFGRNPVFDQSEVEQMVDAGVQKLTNMQNSDGGWGWFSGSYESSWPHTTATVVRGLVIARANGAAIVPDVIERGLTWLEQYQNKRLQEIKAEDRLPSNEDALVFQTLVASDRRNDEMQQLLYDHRDKLSVYGKTLVALATHKLGNVEQTSMLRRNIEQFLVEDASNETAYLRDGSSWWYWYGSEIESTAMYLKLLAAVEPKGRVAPRLVKYLLNNRKHATYWNSTRDTSLVIEAFADYLRASGETKSTVGGEVWLDGKRLGSVSFTPQTMFTAETSVMIAGSAVPAGQQKLEIRKTGQGPLYYSVYSTNFTLEEEIAPAGLEVKIERRYYKLNPVRKDLTLAGDRGQVRAAQRAAYERVVIEDLAALPSGTLVEVELLVESKNDYEYLIIEERKAAGLEAVDVQSGYDYADGLGVYREMREKHVAFFLRTLARGQHSLRYQLRTEAPGQYTALPAVISGMYAPELVGNSSDKDFRIED